MLFTFLYISDAVNVPVGGFSSMGVGDIVTAGPLASPVRGALLLPSSVETKGEGSLKFHNE